MAAIFGSCGHIIHEVKSIWVRSMDNAGNRCVALVVLCPGCTALARDCVVGDASLPLEEVWPRRNDGPYW